MAIGGGHALTSHDAAAAAPSTTGGRRREVPIELSWQVSGDSQAVVAMRGDLDIATVDRVVRYVIDVIDHHDGPVSVDLHGVGFCDACGLGALIRIAAHAERADRQLDLTRPSRALTKIMRITGVDHLLLTPGRPGLGAVPPGSLESPAEGRA